VKFKSRLFEIHDIAKRRIGILAYRGGLK